MTDAPSISRRAKDSLRIGILGGTFDPLHLGHLDAAEAARSALALDEVLFVPSHDPPHRSIDPRASSFHRFALIALGIAGRDGCRVLDFELQREGPSYTALTLRELHARGWRPSQLFFILGSDAFAEIATWYDYPAILDACHFAVIARPGMTLDAALARTPSLTTRVRYPSGHRTDHVETAVFPIEAATAPVSSSEIRARISAGQSIADMVPPAVGRHIHRHALYKRVDDLHGQD